MKLKKEISYESMIPAKYCIPVKLLQEYTLFIAQNLPKKKTGRPRIEDEKLIAGIYYLLKTGCQWDALPHCFGSAKTVYHRFKELIKTNAFGKIWKNVLRQYDDSVGLALNHQCIDSCHKKAPFGGDKTGKNPVDRRKLGTKIVLVVDGKGIPIGSIVSGSNTHDSQLLKPLLNNVSHQINQSRNHYFHTDKGFSSAYNRSIVISNNYTPVMPVRKNQKKAALINREKDEKRWVVERTFSWITRFRRVSIRYEKLSSHYLALLQFAYQIIIFNQI